MQATTPEDKNRNASVIDVVAKLEERAREVIAEIPERTGFYGATGDFDGFLALGGTRSRRQKTKAERAALRGALCAFCEAITELTGDSTWFEVERRLVAEMRSISPLVAVSGVWT